MIKIFVMVDQTNSTLNEEKLLDISRIHSIGVAEYSSSNAINRDERVRREEREGIIAFVAVRNDKKPLSMRFLTGLKNIFQKQLPMMPKEYIARLVYDRSHRSLAIVKLPYEVVGGITYKPFYDRHFAEIVFCAIMSSEQVKGYGSYLMNKLKEQVKTEGDVHHFLTFADNYATGYFAKQGFTDEITLDRSIWGGYIKDYDGGTLMQCTMVPKVDYLRIQETVDVQKRALFEKMKTKSKSHLVYPSIAPLLRLKGAPLAIPEIPGVLEAGWTPEMSRASERPRKGRLFEFLRPLLTETQNHASSWPFLEPVNAKEVPDYYTTILNPMGRIALLWNFYLLDLKTMEDRLEAETYTSIETFAFDFQLVVDNCRTYNPPNTLYWKCADRLEAHFKSRLKARLATLAPTDPLVVGMSSTALSNSESQSKKQKMET